MFINFILTLFCFIFARFKVNKICKLINTKYKKSNKYNSCCFCSLVKVVLKAYI